MSQQCNKILLQKRKFGPCSIETFLKHKIENNKSEEEYIKHYIHNICIENSKIELICEIKLIYLQSEIDNEIEDKIIVETYLMCISNRKKYNKFNINSDIYNNGYESSARVFIVPTEYDDRENEYYDLMNKKYDLLDNYIIYNKCDMYGNYTSSNIKLYDSNIDETFNFNIKKIDKNNKFKVYQPGDKFINKLSNKNKIYRPPNLKSKNEELYSIIIKNIPNTYNCTSIQNYLKQIFSKYPSFIRLKVIKDRKTNGNSGIAFCDFSDNNCISKIINGERIIIDHSVLYIERKKISSM